jgi:hypothetical protein
LGEVVAAIDPDGGHTPVWCREGQGGLGDSARPRVREEPFRPPARGPVAILTDGDTASAAEILTIAFCGNAAKTRSFGAPANGTATATRTFESAAQWLHMHDDCG